MEKNKMKKVSIEFEPITFRAQIERSKLLGRKSETRGCVR
jgi:hypothetical protein